LYEVDAASWIQGDRLPQDQRAPGARECPPATELEELGRRSDQSDDAHQDTDNEHDCLHGHRTLTLDKALAASIRMHPYVSKEMNKALTDPVNLSFSFLRHIEAMDPTRIGLFDLAEKRLVWTAQRQSVLATNIANANTPAFQARDVQSFASMLSGRGSVEPTRTQPAHMTGTAPSGLASLTTDPPEARALDGNTVALDQQLTKVADTETTQALVTTIWKKYMGMFSMALGRSS
jgi:flagellar basal-body rod protein FlgB